METPTRITRLHDATKRKYWELELRGREHLVRKSKLIFRGLDSDYKSSLQTFDDDAAAEADADKKIAAMKKKGFEPFEPPGPRPIPKQITSSFAKSNDVFAVRDMLDAGAEVSMPKLASGGSSDVLIDLAKRGVEIDPACLASAAANGDDRLVKWLLSDGGVPVDSPGGDGSTALMNAAEKGKGKVVTALLGAGADVDAREPGGATPLMHAAAGGKTEIVDAVLAHGPDVNARSERGNTPLSVALRSAKKAKKAKLAELTSILRRLLEAGAQPSDDDRVALERLGVDVPAAGAEPTRDESRRAEAMGTWTLRKVRYLEAPGGSDGGLGERDASGKTLVVDDDGSIRLLRGKRERKGRWTIHRSEIETVFDRAGKRTIELSESGHRLSLHDYDEEHDARFVEIFTKE